MKAAVFEGKEKVIYKDVEDPKISSDEVLIKVKYCGICGTDVAFYFANMPYLDIGEQKYPFIAGHEWSGEIVNIGRNVKSLKIGDRVTGDVSIGCGKCRECLEGKYNLCNERYEVGVYRNKPGGMARYLTMPERHVYRFSDDVDFIGGAIVEPLATAIHGLDRGKICYGDNILITGTGLIGILAAQVASINKGSTVVLTGRSKEKLDIARECGVKNVINVKEEDIKKYLEEKGIFNNIAFCVECSGNISALKQCIEFVRPGGEISIIGFYENTTEVVNFDDISLKNLEIHGILASPNYFRPALSLLEKGLISYQPLISKVFDLSDVEWAIKYVLDKNNKAIKVMLRVE
jgi:2-desacetyl-2-hydroxyethyl bacteriochlorophyllide A dehydrogenase